MAILQEQLQKEKDLTAALEAGLKMSGGRVPNLATVDEKVSIVPLNCYGIRAFIMHQNINLHMCYIDKGRSY